jgi:purine-binding chemotaxis protein CheW
MRTPDTLLLVRHGQERLGVDLASVREVLRMVAVKPVPGAPPGVLGVMTLRGETIAVLDLETRLPAGAEPPGVDHHLVVLSSSSMPLAIAVSHVDDIEPLVAGNWREAGEILPEGVPVSGVARIGDELIPVLDPAALLTPGEVISMRDAMRLLEKGAPA